MTNEQPLIAHGVRPADLHRWDAGKCPRGSSPCVKVYLADEVDAELKRLGEFEWMYKELQK